MENPNYCDVKSRVLCCPGDEKLRKEWLLTLEKEHESIRFASDEIARKFKILSNSDRVEILLMLEQREHCMDEIAKKLKVRKSAASYHLGILKKHGLICIKKRSRFAYYVLSRKGMNALIISKNI